MYDVKRGAALRHMLLAGMLGMGIGSGAAMAQSAATPSSATPQSGGSQAPTPSGGMGGMSGMDKGGAAKGMSQGGMMDMHGAMMKGMTEMESMPMSGDTDRDFASMMRAHHQGAIDMAQVELQHGNDAKLKAMAKKIIESQRREIKEFDDWLAKHRK